MATFADVKQQADDVRQIRKILEGVAFWLPSDEPVPAALTDATKDLVALPDSAIPLGIVTKDGYKFAGEATKDETEGFGYSEVLRTDVTKMPRSLEFTMLQDLRRPIIELIYGLDLGDKVAGANGEVTFDELPTPTFTEGRVFLIGRDGVGSSEILEARCYTRVKIAEPPEEAWGEGAKSFPVKLDVLTDHAEGTPCRHYIGGRGYNATDHGWVPAGA